MIAGDSDTGRAALAARESDEYYRALFDSNPLAVFLTRPDGRIVDANPAACAMLGMTTDEIRAAGRDVLVESSPQLTTALGERIRAGRASVELTMIRKDGTRFPVLVTSALAPGTAEGPRSFVVVEDITERKLAEAALRASEARYREMFEANPNPMWVVDSETFRFLSVNYAAVSRYGYSRDEFLGMTLEDIRPEDDLPRFHHEVARARERAGVHRFTARHRTRDGTVLDVEIASYPFDVAGRPARLVMPYDITERERAAAERLELERRLQQAQKLESLGGLAGGIAHDFNNILTSVLGNAELALSELPPAAPGRESITEIVQATRRAAALCGQMLAYSGRARPAAEPLDLNALARDISGLLVSGLSNRIRLDLRLFEDLGLMVGDPGQIGQVIVNLLMNAAEAIGDGDGGIILTTRAEDYSREDLLAAGLDRDLPPASYLTLEVEDTGCGMDSETQARIFEPFFTTKFMGRGLGLAATSGIVRAHGGAIQVSSEPGKGTGVKVWFPAGGARTELEGDADVSPGVDRSATTPAPASPAGDRRAS